MKKLLITGLASLAALALAVPAFADGVRVNDPVGVFSEDGRSGYVEVTDEPAVRACNENKGTPAEDALTGYIYLNPAGEPVTPTYGNTNAGAGDADGEGTDNGNPEDGTEESDCPDADGDTTQPL